MINHDRYNEVFWQYWLYQRWLKQQRKAVDYVD
jgi:hypothetical protein